MRFWYTIIFVLIFIRCFAQKDIIAQVRDTEGNIVPYASVLVNEIYGTIADSDGKFKIFDYKNNNPVEVTSTGFESKKFGHFELRDNPYVILKRKYIPRRSPATNDNTELLGYNNDSKLFSKPIMLNHNFEAGIIFPYPNKRSFLSRLKVNIAFKGTPKTPVRINLYSLDEKNLPDSSLLKKEIIFTPGPLLQWLDIDLADQGIEFPSSGLAVTFELLNTSLTKKKLGKEFHLDIAQFTPKSTFEMVIRQDVSPGWYKWSAKPYAVVLEISY